MPDDNVILKRIDRVQYCVTYRVIFLLCLIVACAHVEKADQDVSYARLYDSKWQEYIVEISNIDSLIYRQIEENKTLQIDKKSFNFFTLTQQEGITTFAKYCNARIDVFTDTTEVPVENKKRLTFLLYDKYFDRLGSGDLALEIGVSQTRYTGKKYLYLLKKKSPKTYFIVYSLGESNM